MMNGDTKLERPRQDHNLLVQKEASLAEADGGSGSKASHSRPEETVQFLNGIMNEARPIADDDELTNCDNFEKKINKTDEVDSASTELDEESFELRLDVDDVVTAKRKDVTQDNSSICHQYLEKLDKRSANELSSITQPCVQNEITSTDWASEQPEGSSGYALIQPLQTEPNEVESAGNLGSGVLEEKLVHNQEEHNETTSNGQQDKDKEGQKGLIGDSSKDSDNCNAVEGKETSMEVDDIDGRPGVYGGEMSQDQENHPCSGLAKTGDMQENKDATEEWRIEISDVRTVQDIEEHESDSSGSMAVVDLELSKSFSQSTDFLDDFSSPICRDKTSKRNDGKSADRTQEDSYNCAKMNASSENIDRIDEGTISSLSDHKNVGNSPMSKKKDEKKGGSNQKAAGEEFEVDTGTDVLQDLYNQTSSLHDPELSTMSTTEEGDETIKQTPTKATPASDLLSNLAESVKKIKSEPKDSGYDKALNTSKESSPLSITNLSLGERLRLPPGMCQSVSNNGTKTSSGECQPNNTSQKITPDLPPPSVLPFMSVVITSQSTPQTTTLSSALATNVVSPTNNAIKLATNSDSLGKSTSGNSSVQTKTVAYLLPVTSANSSNRQMFVSVPSMSTKSSAKTRITSTPQPTLVPAVPSKSAVLKQSNGNDFSVRNIEEDVFNMCVKHKVKSIDLMKVTEFLQRKNAIKCFKGCKPPDHLNLDKKSHNCLECGDSFALESSLDDHMKRCSLKIHFFCNECEGDKQFHNKCQLLSHMRTHASAPNSDKPLPPLKINSELISILTPTAEDLEEVYPDVDISSLSVTSVGEHKVRCQICNLEFGEGGQLKHHFGYNDVICSFAYQCPNCPQILPRQCALKAHMRVHKRSPPFVCPECGKVFMGVKAYSNFTVHIIEDCYHSNRVPLLMCHKCKMKLDGVTNVKSHLLLTHVKIYMKCQLCSLAFDKRERYNHHMHTAHHMRGGAVALSINSCEICNTLLQTKELLHKHMDLHIQEMKKNARFGFKCMDCPIQTPIFSTRQLLFEHKQNVHKKERLWHRCFDCGLKFKSPQEYTAHQNRAHRQQPVQGERKTVNIVYRCRNCELTFLSPTQLNAHACSGLQQSQLVVCMCTKCKTVLPGMNFDSHTCPTSVSKAQPSVKSPPNAKKAPFPVQILPGPQQSNQCPAQTVPSSLPNQSDSKSKMSLQLSGSGALLNYRCVYCKQTFPTVEMLETHFASCRNTHESSFTKPGRRMPVTLLSCNFCSVRFPTKKRLSLHIKEHNRKGNPMCHKCKIMAFKTSSELKEHLLTCDPIPDTVDPKEKENCKICEKKLFPFEKVKHLSQHSSTGVLICRHCQKLDFSFKDELNAHEIKCGFKNHPLEHSYCYTCHKTLPGLDHLVVHLQEHVFDGTLICIKCQRTGFKNIRELQTHHETCGKELMASMPGQLCSLCREAFPSKDINKLYRHLTQHVVRGVHICCNCQKMGWNNFHEMKSHQISCGLVEAERKRKMPFQCTICQAGFMHSESYRGHVRVHRERGSLICVKCQKLGWKNEEELSSHEKECSFNYVPHAVQTKKENQVQDLKSQIQQSKKNSYENVHGYSKAPSPKDTNSQGYKTMDHFCEHCGKKYSKLSLLLSHISQEHTSFPCHLCGLTYGTKSALVSHVNVVHDGKRSFFSCDICNAKQISRRFASDKGLQKHIQKAHKYCRRSSSTDGKDGEEKDDVQLSSSNAVIKTASPPPVKRLRVEGDTVYTCAKCSLVTDNAAKFADHIKEHNTDQANQCPDCGLCFTILPALKKHLFMVHKIRDSDKYLQDKGMKTEEEEYTSDSEEVSPVIKKMKLMTKYEEDESSSGNPLECTVCHREFPNEKQLRTHMRIHGMAFIRSRRRTGSKMCASSSPPDQESPSKSDNSLGDSPSADKVNRADKELKKEKMEEENVESFPITTLREETMESVQQDKEDSSSKEEILENVIIKEEAMDCSD